MSQRIYREQPQAVKDKISQSMKTYHANKSEQAKETTRNRQACSMRAYWQQVPHYENNSYNQY